MSAEVWSIINATPDSFFEGSRSPDAELATQRASEAIRDGAAVLDIGAMSTRPGFTPISAEQEFVRLDRAMGAIRAVLPEAYLSVDTYRAEIVERAHDKFGRFTVNDIAGGELDQNMFDTVAGLALPYVMMSQQDTIEAMVAFFERAITRAENAGIKDIIIDPGFGFGKSLAQNFQILHNIGKLKQFGRKILVGISRKSMIFKTLDTTPELSLQGTTALHFECLVQGADILRVHDTLAATQTIKLYEAYIGNNR